MVDLAVKKFSEIFEDEYLKSQLPFKIDLEFIQPENYKEVDVAGYKMRSILDLTTAEAWFLGKMDDRQDENPIDKKIKALTADILSKVAKAYGITIVEISKMSAEEYVNFLDSNEEAKTKANDATRAIALEKDRLEKDISFVEDRLMRVTLFMITRYDLNWTLIDSFNKFYTDAKTLEAIEKFILCESLKTPYAQKEKVTQDQGQIQEQAKQLAAEKEGKKERTTAGVTGSGNFKS